MVRIHLYVMNQTIPISNKFILIFFEGNLILSNTCVKKN